MKNKHTELLLFLKFLLFFVFSAGLFFADTLLITWFFVYFLAGLFINKNNRKLYFACILLFLSSNLLLGLNFEVFQQIFDIGHVSPAHLLATRHPHFLRYLVVYPATLVYQLKGATIHMSYTYYCFLLLALLSVNIKSVFANIYSKSTYKHLITISIIYLITFAMNGRLIPAYLGMSLIINHSISLFLKNDYRFTLPFSKAFVLLLGFFFSAVSSGTMMITLVTAVFCVFILIFKKSNKNFCSAVTSVFIAAVIFFVTLFVAQMAMRNIEFFSSNIIGIFNHGLGKYLGFSPIMIPIAFIVFPITFILVSAYLLNIVKYNLKILPIVVAVPFSILGGIFGISTATMVLLPISILMSYYSPEISLRREKNEFLLRNK